MGTFRSQLIASPKVKIRPWLQDFGGYTLTQVTRPDRRPPTRQGAIGWMLWNAGMDYTWGAFGKPPAA